jgi:protein kinase-like protein
LSHPGICTVYALEDIGEELFIVSEFVDGHTLREEIVGGDRPSPHMVARAAQELAAALAVAHERGVTHRDLKPENVMRGRDGRLKILDFGLATVSVSALPEKPPDPFSIHGELVGTPAYMTPEQLTGVRSDLRSDLFQLGMVLHEYAAGTHPFAAPTFMARTARVLEGAPDLLDAARPDLPAGVLHVVERCLRKSPSERFQSAGDLMGVLAADTLPPASRSAVWWRTHQLVVIALYFTACVVGWQIKERRHGASTVVFLALGVIATVGGVFRGHLAFTERFNRGSIHDERRRASPILLTTDLAIALLLGIDGGSMAMSKPLFAVLTFALGLGVALARVVLEPVTIASTFPEANIRARD